MKLSDDFLQEAIDFLRIQDRDLARIICQEGRCRLIIEPKSPYHALVQAIAGQQLHAVAAQAILNRLKQLDDGHFPEPERLLTYTVEQLRSCGFSMRKINSLYVLAEESVHDRIPSYEQALELSDQHLIDLLVKLPGIGRWTVEMLLIFTLGRMDVMPVDDFAIREGWRICKDMLVQPKPRELRVLTEGWSPYRSIGAWYLWRAVESRKPVNRQNPLTL